MTKIYAGAAVAAITMLLGGTAIWVYLNQNAYTECRGSTVGGAAIGGPFTLINQAGETVTDADVITGPTLVYFGFTFCPDVCPLDVARNAETVDILEEMGVDVTPVLISIDPERDTPEVMADYVEAMHPKMIGLTGSAEQVKAASTAYKTFYKAKAAVDGYYQVDHTTLTYLMLPETGFAAAFKRDLSSNEMAERVACILAAE